MARCLSWEAEDTQAPVATLVHLKVHGDGEGWKKEANDAEEVAAEQFALAGVETYEA